MTHTAWVADRYGRRVALLMGGVYALIVSESWRDSPQCLVTLTVARSPVAWMFGKLLVGMSVGVSQVVVNPYVTEVAPNRCRGAIIVVGMAW